jgi:hypothetical protein
MTTDNIILQRALIKLKPEDQNYILECINRSEEAIVFGSYSRGCETPESDIDILFVGDGPRRKSKMLDLIWQSKRQINSRSWLGSELAAHIKHYGIWIKGEGQWKENVKISKTSINKKKLKILYALSHLYVKRSDLEINSRIEILSKIFLDLFRLGYLINREAVPPTLIIKDKIASWNHGFDFFTKELLGNVGITLFDENMEDINMIEVIQKLCPGFSSQVSWHSSDNFRVIINDLS